MDKRWDIRETVGTGPLPETIVSPIDNAEMVLVPAGEFVMGITQEELAQIYRIHEQQVPIFATEVPARNLIEETFYIDRYPVTNFQYRQFLKATGHRSPILIDHADWGKPMQPVVFVGWNDARKYARWAGKLLPTETQWEKAARGTDGRWWAWGQDFLPGRCNSKEFGIKRTCDIGLFDSGVSPYGCYDMCGNVWEMCEGQWLNEYLPMRGGCFLGSATFVRTTCRWTPEDPNDGAHWLGFRCVKTIPSK